MIHVIEGPDKSGKSSFAKAWSQMKGLPLIPHEGMEDIKDGLTDGEVYYTTKRRDLDMFRMAEAGFDFVVDRGFVTVITYGWAFHRSRYNLAYANELLKELHKRGLLALYRMNTPLETVLRRFKREEEHWEGKETCKRIYAAYELFWKEYGANLDPFLVTGEIIGEKKAWKVERRGQTESCQEV